mmetsp:Transcript_97985/g.227224  ORF Transcript_97985/g.227224 Transcript_97985/m.227224 type:complete len:213 (+) Transcript_97985:223-861(+)
MLQVQWQQCAQQLAQHCGCKSKKMRSTASQRPYFLGGTVLWDQEARTRTGRGTTGPTPAALASGKLSCRAAAARSSNAALKLLRCFTWSNCTTRDSKSAKFTTRVSPAKASVGSCGNSSQILNSANGYSTSCSLTSRHPSSRSTRRMTGSPSIKTLTPCTNNCAIHSSIEPVHVSVAGIVRGRSGCPLPGGTVSQALGSNSCSCFNCSCCRR